MESAALSYFHPLVAEWFEKTHRHPTSVQAEAWPKIVEGQDVLVIAPTGSGKTLTGFLGALSKLVGREERSPGTRVLYISPLKALSNDIEKNLKRPLAALEALAEERGAPFPEIRIGLRTGDTTERARREQFKSPPEILVSTPESLYILLTSESGRKLLENVETIIIDEIHAVLRDKRGPHLALSLARLDSLVVGAGRREPQRIGLSATQKPKERVLEFLLGRSEKRGRKSSIVDRGHQRTLDLGLRLPRSPLAPVLSTDVWEEIYDNLAEEILLHRTTIVFSNTRRQAERITRHLATRLGKDAITSHHGSLSKELRLDAEQRLKEGCLRALVATASMELGIDVGDIELVCQIGSPRSIAALLQRVGRSGHSITGTPKGRLYPLSRNDLAECIALLDSVHRGELDVIPKRAGPFDILAQQLVAEVSARSYGEDELFSLVRSAAPYAELARSDFDEVVAMLVSGFVSARGPRAALLHRDGVNRILHARRGARLTALLGGGAIPENFEYDVLLVPNDTKIGSLNEDFAIESSVGDVFQLGNRSYQIQRIDPGTMRVRDAEGALPNLPFWLGEAPSRTDELSASVSRLRARKESSPETSFEVLLGDLSLPREAYVELDEYFDASKRALGCLPTQERLVAERFFDETGGMHVVVHSPYGARINRAFGLALRKKFSRAFNVELQAAADDDALLLSLGPMHSFPLDELPRFLRRSAAPQALSQALLDAPLFATRFRQNATRALSIARFRGGRKVPPRFQRMEADDFLAHCFPDQVACIENLSGPREIPDHPIVRQTMTDCLEDAMDQEGLFRLLERIESGEVEFLTREGTEPSPLSAEILNSRPYAFLDDAPLEERRSQAVKRGGRLKDVTDTGVVSPSAIERVLGEIALDVRNAEELCDRLFVHGYLFASEIEHADALSFLEHLYEDGRVGKFPIDGDALWFVRERATEIAAVFTGPFVERFRDRGFGSVEKTHALRELVRGRLSLVGPTNVRELANRLPVSVDAVASVLVELETEGFALGGYFRDPKVRDYCDRRLLRRIYAYGKSERRSRTEPVSVASYLRFLVDHHGLTPARRRTGIGGLLAVVEQLAGYGAPFDAWDSNIFPARLTSYLASDLDVLGWSGQIAWGAIERTSRGHLSQVPFTFCLRQNAKHFLGDRPGRAPLGADESRIEAISSRGGAMFLDDLARESRLLPAQFDEAIRSLLTRGLLTFDAPSHLRALLAKRKSPRPGAASREPLRSRAGRVEWLGAKNLYEEESARHEALTSTALTLLGRYGVLCRSILEKEISRPAYRDLLGVLFRLEARGEIRGGRFISGISGEQFALPSVASVLGDYRAAAETPHFCLISPADPLNMLGVLLPKETLASGALLVLKDGVPIAQKIGPRYFEFTEGGLAGFAPGVVSQPPRRATRAPASG